MSLKVSVIAPLKNEAQFIGYSVMAALPHVHEFIYAIAPSTDDGSIEILRHIVKNYGHLGGKVRLLIDKKYDFDPHDTAAYNLAFQDCIDQASGDVCFFYHPDMVITKWADLPENSDALAWTVQMTSYAGNMQTVISRGRSTQWKNIHKKRFGLIYQGGYGSQNEDFYHSEITGKSYKHFGTDFQQYPYEVANSGINVNHYCELKPYKRRLEKMKLCLKTLAPTAPEAWVVEAASQHPRVTLEQSSDRFGKFTFEEDDLPIPEVFTKYKAEFEPFTKELIHG